MADNEEYLSWVESRRLIISQLTAMDGSIRDLVTRIDKYNESARDKVAELSREAQTRISELTLRVAMLELRAKLWGGAIGLLSGGIATGLVNMLMASMSIRH